MNRADAESVARRIRFSALFHAESYAQGLPRYLDPALHYAVIGELLGRQPSARFDPAFYLTRYDDLAHHAASPLHHYLQFGQVEGRRAVPAVSRLAFPPLPDNGRPSVILLVHEASRTGAPMLGWNVVRGLAGSYNVVSVLMHGGNLGEHFADVSAATVGPMTSEDWHVVEMERIAERLVAEYSPLFAIANSIETHLFVPALAKLGVPSVALVHEFAAYTRPLSKMRDVLDWASHVVFPASLVANSSYTAFPALRRRRGIHVLAQGQADLPGSRANTSVIEAENSGVAVGRLVRPEDKSDCFVVLGLGTVQVRKGVDLFLAAASSARRLAPNRHFRFVWIGAGYDPIGDAAYSAYLAEQIARSDLSDTVSILDEVDDLDGAYAQADVFFMCSRLDPQPNVSIYALTRGIPTVCFEQASGTAELLVADPETRMLVVPYLDAHAAAAVICGLAHDPAALAAMRRASARVANVHFNMTAYIAQVDEWGRAAAAALRPDDLRTLADAAVVDADLALPPEALAPGVLGVERHVLQQWAVVGTSLDQTSNPQFRRPCAGFHPQAYAQAHSDSCGEGGVNPLAHWLRAGRPSGPWSHQVFFPDSRASLDGSARIALHAHFYYLTAAHDLASRLSRNESSCDLFLSTDTSAKAARLQDAFAGHNGTVDVRVMPNKGRDIGPFLTGFRHEIMRGGYHIFGHVHGKQSLAVYAPMGTSWREFLWDNLLGGVHPMLDVVAGAFATNPDLGLLMAEDPHLVGWDENRGIAERIAARMGLRVPLDDFFDFPLGNMFWARPSALAPLLDLNLTWEDYPPEPLPNDGSLLHALERILPYVVRHAGLSVASVRVPGTTW
jgi:glycosyltransferase involved in cell wall biosynthesis